MFRLFLAGEWPVSCRAAQDAAARGVPAVAPRGLRGSFGRFSTGPSDFARRVRFWLLVFGFWCLERSIGICHQRLVAGEGLIANGLPVVYI